MNIMLTGLILTMVFSAFRLAGVSRRERAALDESFRIIRDSNLPSIANSVFFINSELMEIQLQGILQMEYMVYLKLTDTLLPDGSAQDLIKRFRIAGMPLPILIMSGVTREEIRLTEDQKKLLLSKPFTRDELLDHIRKGLGQQ